MCDMGDTEHRVVCNFAESDPEAKFFLIEAPLLPKFVEVRDDDE